MSKVKDENFINIQGWMINSLKLKGNELLVYAIIYGFSQDGETRFTGSLQYLADWTSSTKQGITKNLKALVEKGYIVKEEKYINGVKFCEYYVTRFNVVLNSVERGIKQSLMGGIKQSLINNLDIDNKEEKKEDNKKFMPPTVGAVSEYCLERNNNIDPEQFVNYYESKGWMIGRNKMKDWKAAVRTWEKNKYSNRKKNGADDLEASYRMYSDWASS